MLSSVFVIFLLMLIKDCMTSRQKWLGSCNKTFSKYFALQPVNFSTCMYRINLNKIISMGDAYSGEVIKDLSNPFWKNILESWIQYIKSFEIDSLVKVIYSPLWGNSQINGNRYFIINEWYNKGIRNVIDVIDENGLIYDFQTLKDRYNIHGTYLDYAQLINRIPRLWREIINENSRNIIMYRYNVQINPYIFCLLRKRRGCRDVYDKTRGPMVL